MNIAATGSPGTRCNIRKVMTDTPKSTGTANTNRRNAYRMNELH
jgi:hypothetical protein